MKHFTSALAIVPSGLGEDFRKLGYANVVELGWWQAHALGDTAVTFVPIDIALLPIGAYDPEWFMRKQHMNPEDAVRAFRDLNAKRMLAMHWGTHQLTDEWLGDPPEKLKALLRGATDADRVEVVPIGQTVAI